MAFDILKEVLQRLSTKYDINLDHIKRGYAYLKRYGYLHKLSGLSDFIEAVLLFQKVAGLKNDGELGPKTLRAMTWRRCSVPDFVMGEDNVLSMEVLSAKWGRRNLTYFIEKREII